MGISLLTGSNPIPRGNEGVYVIRNQWFLEKKSPTLVGNENGTFKVRHINLSAKVNPPLTYFDKLLLTTSNKASLVSRHVQRVNCSWLGTFQFSNHGSIICFPVAKFAVCATCEYLKFFLTKCHTFKKCVGKYSILSSSLSGSCTKKKKYIFKKDSEKYHSKVRTHVMVLSTPIFNYHWKKSSLSLVKYSKWLKSNIIRKLAVIC